MSEAYYLRHEASDIDDLLDEVDAGKSMATAEEHAKIASSLSLSVPSATIAEDSDIDDYITAGQYKSTGVSLSGISNIPDSTHDFELIVMHTIATETGIQIIIYETGDIYIRTMVTIQDVTTFGSWKQLKTEAIA